jgi:adenylate cyclase
MSEQDRTRLIRSSPALADEAIDLGPWVDAHATVLVADIRGFTALMSALPLPSMAALLNRWFATMTEIIQGFGGLVDKFVGDAVIALFGLPQASGDDAVRALACAAAMQQGMVALNRELEVQGLPPIFVGIAVSTGEVVAGSFGSDAHREYTAIGEVMNLASRIESFALRGQVLVSASTLAEASGQIAEGIEVGPVNEVRFKGLARPVQLFDLRAVHGREQPLRVPRVEVRRSPRIRAQIDATFRQIEHKRVVPAAIPGLINDLGYYGLRADLPLGLPDAADVVINLAPRDGATPIGDVYAKVVRSSPHARGFRTSLELTSVETPAHRRLKELVDESLWRR